MPGPIEAEVDIGEIDMVKVAGQMTIKVTYKRVREMRIRLWMATRLIILAAIITGMGIEFVDDQEDDDAQG